MLRPIVLMTLAVNVHTKPLDCKLTDFPFRRRHRLQSFFNKILITTSHIASPYTASTEAIAGAPKLESGLVDARQKATFLAATAPHTGDWLSAVPIAACGLRLDDEAVRVAEALRLELKVCVPHSCHCGQDVDAWGLNAFVCKHAPGRIQRHHALNDIIARACASAGVPVSKEPSVSFQATSEGLTASP